MATTYAETHRHVDSGWWIKHGIVGGIIAAIGMLMAEMIIAALMGMDAFGPPRMIAGIALGPSAMQPSTPLMTAALVGMMLLVLSIVYGLIFAAIVANIQVLQSSAPVIGAATVYGLLLWLINFYVIAPPAGWVWFPTMANPVQQFLSHAFAFGTVLGIYLDRALVTRREPVGATVHA